jgi:hypothetical protein
MYVPELYLALIIGGWLIDSGAKKRRKAAKRAAKVVAATPAQPRLLRLPSETEEYAAYLADIRAKIAAQNAR